MPTGFVLPLCPTKSLWLSRSGSLSAGVCSHFSMFFSSLWRQLGASQSSPPGGCFPFPTTGVSSGLSSGRFYIWPCWVWTLQSSCSLEIPILGGPCANSRIVWWFPGGAQPGSSGLSLGLVSREMLVGSLGSPVGREARILVHTWLIVTPSRLVAGTPACDPVFHLVEFTPLP